MIYGRRLHLLPDGLLKCLRAFRQSPHEATKFPASTKSIRTISGNPRAVWQKIGQATLALGELDRAEIAWNNTVSFRRQIAQDDLNNAAGHRLLHCALEYQARV